MNKLLSYSSFYAYEDASGIPVQSLKRMNYETIPYSILDGDVTFDKGAILESQSLREGTYILLNDQLFKSSN